MTKPAAFNGEARFSCDGEDYHLTLNNMALLEAEAVLDQSMLDFVPAIAETLQAGRNPQMRHMAALIYGGLKLNHPEITQQRVLDMVMARDQALISALGEAMAGIDIPDDPDAELGNAPAPVNRREKKAAAKMAGTGTGSSKRGAKQGSSRKRSG